MFKKATGLGATTVIELVDAELSGIKNSGTLKATYTQAGVPAVGTLGSTALSWSDVGGAQTYEVTLNQVNPENGSNEIVLGETAGKVNGTADIHNDDVFLMVPQDMAADTQKLTITWRVKVYDNAEHAAANGGVGLLSETINTKDLSLYSDLMTSDSDDTHVGAINWTRNSFITYNITIGPRPIRFTAEVADWADEVNAFINVH